MVWKHSYSVSASDKRTYFYNNSFFHLLLLVAPSLWFTMVFLSLFCKEKELTDFNSFLLTFPAQLLRNSIV